MSNPLITIHEAVQVRYGAIANGEAGNCCGTDSACCGMENGVTLYDDAMLTQLPDSVTAISLGCGDPVTIANLKPGEWVLDLGSGGGIDCFLAAQRVGAQGYVIGVDMTRAMLDQANASKVRIGVTNVEFRRGQIEDLPVVSDSIDVVMSNCVINLSPDKQAVFHEALRVLKPGGRISVSDIISETPFTDVHRADATTWAECVSGAVTSDEYLAMMRTAGFVDIEIVDQVSADGIVERRDGMPRVFSMRVTARKASHQEGR